MFDYGMVSRDRVNGVRPSQTGDRHGGSFEKPFGGLSCKTAMSINLDTHNIHIYIYISITF